MVKKNLIVITICGLALGLYSCTSPGPNNSVTSSITTGGGVPGQVITITQADYIKFSECDVKKTPNENAKVDKQKRLADVKAMNSTQYDTFLVTQSETQKGLVLRYCE